MASLVFRTTKLPGFMQTHFTQSRSELQIVWSRPKVFSRTETYRLLRGLQIGFQCADCPEARMLLV